MKPHNHTNSQWKKSEKRSEKIVQERDSRRADRIRNQNPLFSKKADRNGDK